MQYSSHCAAAAAVAAKEFPEGSGFSLVPSFNFAMEVQGRAGSNFMKLLDFGELVFQQGFDHAGIILLRLPEADFAARAKHLDAVLAEHEANLSRGDFLVVTHGQVRVANQPRRQRPLTRSN